MGRAPCCDKANVKKGPWSPEEDVKLKDYIEQHGTGGNWIALPQKIGLKRCGKSCRLRWLNYLRPDIRHGGFSEEEENIICSLFISIGSRWSIIAAQLPGRTDNDIKNYWNTRLKKKLLGKQRKEQQARRLGCLKQEMKKAISGSLNMVNVVDHNNQFFQVDNHHHNQLSMSSYPPYLNQTPGLVDDQDSIRKLLIKLGGRFCQDTNNTQTIIEGTNMNNPESSMSMNSSIQEQYYENPINIVSTSSPSVTMSSFNNPSCSQLLNDQYDINEAGMNILQGFNNFSIDVNENMVYNNDSQRLVEGVGNDQCFYGMEMGNGSNTTGTSSIESTTWVDMASLVYPPTIMHNNNNNNYGNCQLQGEMIQECGFEASSYLV